jgi:hypothetical protein
VLIIHDLGVTVTGLRVGWFASRSASGGVSASRWQDRRKPGHPVADMAIVTLTSSTDGSATLESRGFAEWRRRLVRIQSSLLLNHGAAAVPCLA